MTSVLGRALAVGALAWLAVSSVVTLWGRPAEAAAFGSFCVVAALVAALTWRYAGR